MFLMQRLVSSWMCLNSNRGSQLKSTMEMPQMQTTKIKKRAEEHLGAEDKQEKNGIELKGGWNEI